MTDSENIAYNNGIIIGMASKGIIKCDIQSGNIIEYETYNGITYGLVISTINDITLYESTQYE